LGQADFFNICVLFDFWY